MKSLELAQMDYVVFDFETTGFYAESGDEVIEIGAVLIEKAQISKKTFQSLVNPGRSIPAASSAVSGIKDADVADAPRIHQVLPDFMQFIGSRILVAQNAKFDLSFLLKDLRKLQIPFKQNLVIDTIGMSKIVFPYEQSHSLDAMMARLGIARTGERHRSLDDSRYTGLVLLELIDLLARQGIKQLPEIESAFVRPDSVLKPQRQTTRALF